LLFATESDAILVVNLETARFEEVNQAAMSLYGYSREEFLRLQVFSVSAEPERTRQALAVKERTVTLRLHRKKDGTVFPVEIMGSYFESAGRRMHVAAIRDITERKRAEDELQKLSLAVEQSPASVVLTDLNGIIEYVNPRYCQVTGYTAQEAVGQNPRLLKSGKMAPETYADLWSTIVAGREWDGELLNRRKNGELFWERALISPVKDAEGRTTHYLAIKEDVTERKRAEEELKASREKLQALSFALSKAEHYERRRIANLLHDEVIQALALTRIKLGALRAKLSTPEKQHLLDALREHLDRAIVSTRRTTFQISPPILHELGLEAALSWLADQIAEQHNLPCVCVALGPRVRVDGETASLLFTAVRELLHNVVKHAQAASANISISAESGTLRIVVEDDGCGFGEASVPPASNKNGGFGLFNIRERLNYLGGQCLVKSAPHQGTQVTLSVPLKPA